MSELCYTENMHSPSRDTPYSRKSNKPLMEKRRRSRINNCLNDLKALVLDALKKDSSRYSKLEKADILEMTVKHLRSVQRQQISAAITNDPSVIGKYRAGYNECANEVSRYLSAVEGMDADTRCRLLSHLAGCMPAEQKPQQQAPQPSQPLTQPIQVQIPIIPNVLSVSSNGSVQTPTLLTASPVQATQVAALPGANGGSDVTRFTGAIQVVPTRLPSGAIALIVPGQSFQQSPTTYQYVQGTSPVQISPSVAIQPTVVNQMIVSPVPASEAPVSTVRTPSPQMFMTTTTSPALSPVSPKQTIHVPTAQHARQENPWRPW